MPPHFMHQKADEYIRQKQQGLGCPIVSWKNNTHQLVAVRNKLYSSAKWKTFPDFLADYIKIVLDSSWGNSELAKEKSDRHPIINWHQEYCLYQQTIILTPGKISSGESIGIVSCYLGLAYNLYLIDHNVELQDRMIKRLKDRSNFQGAFYELMVAGALIRAGYELVLEDETDRKSRHCEFAAIKRSTKKRYSVEAKMRSVAGLLGKTARDGGTDKSPLGRLQGHLHDALAKPSRDERLVFIDLNAPIDMTEGESTPRLIETALRRLESYENNPQSPSEKAYVFFTNLAFHRNLNGPTSAVVAPFGYRIPDFNRSGRSTFADRYRQEKKHKDAIEIAATLVECGRFPSTFDGSMPSETLLGNPQRIKVGETYNFTDAMDGGLTGTVDSAVVMESERSMVISVRAQDGKSYILRERMSDAAFDDYLAHKDAYFGEIRPVPRKAETPYDLFCNLMNIYESYNRNQLINQTMIPHDDPRISTLSDEHLREFICYSLVNSITKRSNPGGSES